MKKALQDELKVTPESLTARIRGLNEMTSDLNAYLKEYCMSEGFDRLKKELESSNQELTAKVESLEASLAEKDAVHAEQMRALAEEHEAKVSLLNQKLETLKETFDAEKVKIEQVAQD